MCWGGEAGRYTHRGGRAPSGLGNRCIRGTEVLRQQDRLLQGELDLLVQSNLGTLDSLRKDVRVSLQVKQPGTYLTPQLQPLCWSLFLPIDPSGVCTSSFLLGWMTAKHTDTLSLWGWFDLIWVFLLNVSWHSVWEG